MFQFTKLAYFNNWFIIDTKPSVNHSSGFVICGGFWYGRHGATAQDGILWGIWRWWWGEMGRRAWASPPPNDVIFIAVKVQLLNALFVLQKIKKTKKMKQGFFVVFFPRYSFFIWVFPSISPVFAAVTTVCVCVCVKRLPSSVRTGSPLSATPPAGRSSVSGMTSVGFWVLTCHLVRTNCTHTLLHTSYHRRHVSRRERKFQNISKLWYQLRQHAECKYWFSTQTYSAYARHTCIQTRSHTLSFFFLFSLFTQNTFYTNIYSKLLSFFFFRRRASAETDGSVGAACGWRLTLQLLTLCTNSTFVFCHLFLFRPFTWNSNMTTCRQRGEEKKKESHRKPTNKKNQNLLAFRVEIFINLCFTAVNNLTETVHLCRIMLNKKKRQLYVSCRNFSSMLYFIFFLN